MQRAEIDSNNLVWSDWATISTVFTPFRWAHVVIVSLDCFIFWSIHAFEVLSSFAFFKVLALLVGLVRWEVEDPPEKTLYGIEISFAGVLVSVTH